MSETPEELIALCDAAEGRPHSCCCPDCERRPHAVAERELAELGFSSPARARSYAALWEKLAEVQFTAVMGREMGEADRHLRRIEELAATFLDALAITGGTK